MSMEATLTRIPMVEEDTTTIPMEEEVTVTTLMAVVDMTVIGDYRRLTSFPDQLRSLDISQYIDPSRIATLRIEGE